MDRLKKSNKLGPKKLVVHKAGGREPHPTRLRPRRTHPWTPAEEETLVTQHSIHGNRWSVLAQYLPGRSDNDVKNIWHSSLRCKNPTSTGSLLRIYADAVRDCCAEADARAKCLAYARERSAVLAAHAGARQFLGGHRRGREVDNDDGEDEHDDEGEDDGERSRSPDSGSPRQRPRVRPHTVYDNEDRMSPGINGRRRLQQAPELGVVHVARQQQLLTAAPGVTLQPLRMAGLPVQVQLGSANGDWQQGNLVGQQGGRPVLQLGTALAAAANGQTLPAGVLHGASLDAFMAAGNTEEAVNALLAELSSQNGGAAVALGLGGGNGQEQRQGGSRVVFQPAQRLQLQSNTGQRGAQFVTAQSVGGGGGGLLTAPQAQLLNLGGGTAWLQTGPALTLDAGGPRVTLGDLQRMAMAQAGLGAWGGGQQTIELGGGRGNGGATLISGLDCLPNGFANVRTAGNGVGGIGPLLAGLSGQQLNGATLQGGGNVADLASLLSAGLPTLWAGDLQ